MTAERGKWRQELAANEVQSLFRNVKVELERPRRCRAGKQLVLRSDKLFFSNSFHLKQTEGFYKSVSGGLDACLVSFKWIAPELTSFIPLGTVYLARCKCERGKSAQSSGRS